MALSPLPRETEKVVPLESQQADGSLIKETGRVPETKSDLQQVESGQKGQALAGEAGVNDSAVETLRAKLGAAGTAAEQAEASLRDTDLQRILAENGNNPKKALLAIMNGVDIGQNIEPYELAEFVEGLGADASRQAKVS